MHFAISTEQDMWYVEWGAIQVGADGKYEYSHEQLGTDDDSHGVFYLHVLFGPTAAFDAWKKSVNTDGAAAGEPKERGIYVLNTTRVVRTR
jgi:hypothetical protein